MTDQTPDLAALEALAEAATPGPWTSYRPHPAYRSYMVERVAPEGHLAGDGAVVCCEDVKASENAEFIAAADPGTVLWLIREVERLTRWKSEALPVLDGLQELGKALGLPLGERITGPAALAAVEALKLRATDAEANARQAWDVHRETVDRLGVVIARHSGDATFATLRADKAEATIQRMRAALADHPRACEAHPEDDPISCGWKRAVLDVQTALDGGEPDA